MSPSPKVLVFDSGVGALSIINELRARLPRVSITYASDNGFFPYGTKGEAELIARVENLFRYLLARVNPNIAVIACNTASTIALPRLREQFSLPIVGVVPAIKPAAEQTITGVIGLIATPATISRSYTHDLISNYASHCEIISLGTSTLVEITEKKLSGDIISAETIAQALAPMQAHPNIEKMDTIVLACTHFPLLKEELTPHFPTYINWLDSGKAIANRVAHLLATEQPALELLDTPQYHSIFTKDNNAARQVAKHLPLYFPGSIEYMQDHSL